MIISLQIFGVIHYGSRLKMAGPRRFRARESPNGAGKCSYKAPHSLICPGLYSLLRGVWGGALPLEISHFIKAFVTGARPFTNRDLFCLLLCFWRAVAQGVLRFRLSRRLESDRLLRIALVSSYHRGYSNPYLLDLPGLPLRFGSSPDFLTCH